MDERKTVFIVIEATTHFGSIITGVTAQMKINRVFDSPEKADAFKVDIERVNSRVGAKYTIEQMEVL